MNCSVDLETAKELLYIPTKEDLELPAQAIAAANDKEIIAGLKDAWDVAGNE